MAMRIPKFCGRALGILSKENKDKKTKSENTRRKSVLYAIFYAVLFIYCIVMCAVSNTVFKGAIFGVLGIINVVFSFVCIKDAINGDA